ncbi:MAG: fused ferrous iron transport protein A/B [Chloroflexota bacterium]
MEDKNEITLTEMSVGESGVVKEIRGGVGARSQLNSLGIIPGKKVTKISAMFLHGPVTCEVDRVRMAIGRGMASKIVVTDIEPKKKKILLMGNPNVGKSLIFTRLSGVRVIVGNYAGKTVGFTRSLMKVGNETAEVIDVPGTYTLEPTSEAEQVAAEMFKEGDVIINVVNATNLERNLYLTLELLERRIPMVVALNLWDDTKHYGIDIDLKKLEELLGVPVVPTTATTGEGVRELVNSIPHSRIPTRTVSSHEERWQAVGSIVEQVQRITHRHHTWRERLADASVKPVSGSFMALIVLVGVFFSVRFIGEGLISRVFDPIFNHLWAPVVLKLSVLLGGGGALHDILVGRVGGGQIDFISSFGLLTSGLYVPFAVEIPYLFSFYLALGILEDTGYLPRLAVLMDTFMHRLGLHGYAIIPNLLGLGCNVPAILATRILESKRERFITSTLISVAVPCAALQAMIIGLMGRFGYRYVIIVYGTLFLVWVMLGLILHHTVKGFSPELLIEIPPYRLPPWRLISAKLWLRLSSFLVEAVPIILGGILVVNILYLLGAFEVIARFTAPVITGLLGLPEGAMVAITLGFLRKDVAMGLLAPLGLTANQLVVASVVLAMTFPCIATFVVLLKELGLKDMLKSVAIMLATSLIVGTLLHAILR